MTKAGGVYKEPIPLSKLFLGKFIILSKDLKLELEFPPSLPILGSLVPLSQSLYFLRVY